MPQAASSSPPLRPFPSTPLPQPLPPPNPVLPEGRCRGWWHLTQPFHNPCYRYVMYHLVTITITSLPRAVSTVYHVYIQFTSSFFLFFCSVSVMYQYVLINVKILLASRNDLIPLIPQLALPSNSHHSLEVCVGASTWSTTRLEHVDHSLEVLLPCWSLSILLTQTSKTKLLKG